MKKMQRPEVRIIQDQQVDTKPAEVSNWEAEQLLMKYGYKQQNFSTHPDTSNINQDPGLTFEEMISQQEAKKKAEYERKLAQMNGPKPTTFDSSRGYSAETKFSSDEETGFGFKVQIVSDMPIPKY